MGLDRLPEELLIIILKQLDLKSIRNLYDTGSRHIQNVISCQGAVKKCSLSLNSLGTVESLNLDFFKSISTYLQELNLSAIQDLKKTAMIPAMKRLNCLVSLNVAYTNITILDFLDIHDVCPTIKNITIDYKFHKAGARSKHFPLSLLTKCQDVFANIENVHFVGSIENLLKSKLPQNILQKAKLNNVTYAIAKEDVFTYHKYTKGKPIYCNNLNIFYLYWRGPRLIMTYENTPEVIQEIPFPYEYVHISYEVNCSSTQFANFFKDKFNAKVNVKPICDQEMLTETNTVFMFWNKKSITFDDMFFNKLEPKLKELFPYNIVYGDDMRPEPIYTNWVCAQHPILIEKCRRREGDRAFKRSRVCSSSVAIDYDELLHEKQKVELSISFFDSVQHPVTLSASSVFLTKLTYLHLTGSIRYSGEFFSILFRCCKNLVTLNVEAPTVSPCVAPISRSIPLSHTLKNFRILDKVIDFELLFSSLSQCKTLENIIVVDLSNVRNDLAKPDTFFKQCEGLYYLCIEASMSETTRDKKLKMLNKVKAKHGRKSLYIELIRHRADFTYTYDPFLEIYKLNRIKVLYYLDLLFMTYLHIEPIPKIKMNIKLFSWFYTVSYLISCFT